MEFLVHSLAGRHPEDAAHALEAIKPAEAAKILRKLPAKTVGSVVEKLSLVAAGAILPQVGAEQMRELLETLRPRQAASILMHLDEGTRATALTGMTARAARQLRDLLEYPPETAGAMMEPQTATVPIDLNVREAIAALRKVPRQTLFYLYVTDREGKLAGVLNTRELLLAPPQQPIADLVHRDVASLPATASRDDVAAFMKHHRFVAVPVVDSSGHLVGVVKHERALDAIREEAFGDLQKMVGAGADEHALSPVPLVVRKRLPWLYVNLVTAFLAAAVVGLFEETIGQVTALAVLLPVVAGQGGNTGSQALAVVIRGVALREVVPGAERGLLWKEALSAFLNGVAVAVVTGVAVLVWDGRTILALVIFLAMIVNMTIAGLAGAAIPLVLRAFGQDPAQSSAIFLTTVTDVVGFGAFLGFAVAFLPLLLA
jgi:magnesium transporter